MGGMLKQWDWQITFLYLPVISGKNVTISFTESKYLCTSELMTGRSFLVQRDDGAWSVMAI
jgi:hypothetical protein